LNTYPKTNPKHECNVATRSPKPIAIALGLGWAWLEFLLCVFSLFFALKLNLIMKKAQ